MFEATAGDNHPVKFSEYANADPFTQLLYRSTNRMLDYGLKNVIEFEDLTTQPASDYVEPLLASLKEHYHTSTSWLIFPRLMVALWKTHFNQLLVVIAGTVLEGIIRIGKPIVLMQFLMKIQDDDSSASMTSELYVLATGLCLLGFAYVVVHHILFFYTMRMGWCWRQTTQALIYDHLLNADNSAIENFPKGHLINLISVDTSKYELFTIFMNFGWCSLLELIAILIVLIYMLDTASGFVGCMATILFIPLQVMIGRQFARLRTITAGNTDKRIRHISESIEGIATVKSYGWETPFFALISMLRNVEMSSIRMAQQLKALNATFDFVVVPVSALAMFTVYWSQNGELTLPKVYAGLLLLQSLRGTMAGHWVLSIESGSEAIASTNRLEKFLQTNTRSGAGIGEEGGDNDSKGVEMVDVKTVESLSKADDCVLKVENKTLAYFSSSEEDKAAERAEQDSDSHKSEEQNLVSSEADADSKKKKEKNDTGNTHSPYSIILRNLNFAVQRNELVMVVGPVGSGKSSLLSAILGEMFEVDLSESTSPDSFTRATNIFDNSKHSIAYCPQQPWILPTSIKNNILLVNKERNNELYKSAIHCACLLPDLKSMPDSDDTEIGERGITISGGQQARVSLARALYGDADVYLLDDPLSAVDAHVSRHIFDNCILDFLKKQGKTTILTTHQLQYLEYADKVLVLDTDGNQSFWGSYEELKLNHKESSLLDFVGQSKISGNDHFDSLPVSRVASAVDLASNTSDAPDFHYGLEEAVAVSVVDDAPSADVDTRLLDDEEKATGVDDVVVDTDISKDKKSSNATEPSAVLQVIATEEKEQGRIKMGVYYEWMKAGGLYRSIFVFLLMAVCQGVSMMNEYWLRWWVEDKFEFYYESTYVWLLAVITFVTLLLGLWHSFSFYDFTIRAASDLHKESVWAIMHSPLSFFTANPSGRILNRFSKDQSIADEQLPITAYVAYKCVLQTLAGVILVCITFPYLLVLFAAIVYIFCEVRHKYLGSMREIKRIEGTTRSPIYSGFSSTLDGLSSIKAFNLEGEMKRRFFHCINQNGNSYWSYLMISRWFGQRLDSLALLVLLGVSYMAVALRDNIDIGLLGFTMVYTLNLTGLFQWTVRQCAEVESFMTSVERIAEYTHLPTEEGYKADQKETDSKLSAMSTPQNSCCGCNCACQCVCCWNPEGHADAIDMVQALDLEQLSPKTGELTSKDITGKVDIKNLVVRYTEDRPAVLKGINISIAAGTKIAIVGRTGSGKSTIMSALLRLNIISSGDVIIDDSSSTLDLSLECCRNLITLIPQTPHLFLGTLRFNIDPFHTHSDADIWNALKDAQLHDFVTQHNDKLDMAIEEGGNNLSAGQKQLLSLARAILRHSKIILFDEVSANIDYDSDKALQATIRTSAALKNATIIIIAHRLLTVVDCNKVFVLDDGLLVEEGHPYTLLTQESEMSPFKALAEKSGNMDQLLQVAQGKYEEKKKSL